MNQTRCPFFSRTKKLDLKLFQEDRNGKDFWFISRKSQETWRLSMKYRKKVDGIFWWNLFKVSTFNLLDNIRHELQTAVHLKWNMSQLWEMICYLKKYGLLCKVDEKCEPRKEGKMLTTRGKVCGFSEARWTKWGEVFTRSCNNKEKTKCC